MTAPPTPAAIGSVQDRPLLGQHHGLYPDITGIWRSWTDAEVTGKVVDSGHHIAEEAPEHMGILLREAWRIIAR